LSLMIWPWSNTCRITWPSCIWAESWKLPAAPTFMVHRGTLTPERSCRRSRSRIHESIWKERFSAVTFQARPIRRPGAPSAHGALWRMRYVVSKCREWWRWGRITLSRVTLCELLSVMWTGKEKRKGVVPSSSALVVEPSKKGSSRVFPRLRPLQAGGGGGRSDPGSGCQESVLCE